MRVTHSTRCTAVLTPGTTPSFWSRGLFWSQAAYDASPNLRKQLMTTAIMAALGFTFATSTSQPPGTVIGSDGTLQYGAHNLTTYSEAFNNGAWGTDGGTWAPSKLTENSATGTHRVYSAFRTWTSGQSYCAYADVALGERRWFYLNASTGFAARATFDLQNGVVGTVTQGTAGIIPLGGGVYRCWIAGVGTGSFAAVYIQICSGTDGPTTESYTGNGTSGIYLYRAQSQVGSVPLDYVATTSAAVYAPRITYDRGASSNFAYNTEDCSLWGLSSAVTASGLAFTETVENTHQIGQFAANITGTFLLTVEVKIPASRGVELLTEHSSGGHYIKWTAAGVATLQNWGTPTGTGSLQEAYVLPDGYIRLTVGVAGASATFTRVYIRAIDNTGSDFYTGSTSATFLYRNLSLQRAQYRGAYLRTTSTAPLYAAGTPKSQNLLTYSADLTNAAWAAGGAAAKSAGTITLSGSGNVKQTLTNLVAGCTYTFAFNAKRGTAGGIDYSVYNDTAGSDIIAATSYYASINSSTYTTIYVVFTVPAGCASVSVYLARTNASGTVFVDSAWVYEGTAQLPHVLTTGTPYSLYPQRSLIHEPARTRETTQPRDLTQAAWTKSGSMTAAKTATGIDGVANSASTLTSSGTNQTCLQSVTSASANRLATAWIRSRSASSITIDMTCDGGTTWTATTVNAAWMPYLASKATVTNPSYGFRLRANGDSIDVDFVQGEQYTTLPSVVPMPIWGTESAAQTLSADRIVEPASWLSQAGPFTVAIRAIPYKANSGASQFLLGNSNNGVVVNSAGNAASYDGTTLVSGGAPSDGVPFTVAARWSGGGQGVSLNGGAVATGSFDGSMGGGTAPDLGADAGGGSAFWGEIISQEFATSAANDATLQKAALGLAA